MLEQEPIEIIPKSGVYYPFRGIKRIEFPSSERIPDRGMIYHVDLSKPEESIAQARLRYGASEGRLCVLAVRPDNNLYTGSEFIGNDTPMGEVSVVSIESYIAGQEQPQEVIKETPLTFGVCFDVATFDDYKALRNYWIRMRLGKRIYTLRCIDPIEDEEVRVHFLNKDEPLTLFNFDTEDVRGNDRKVLIPGHSRFLSRVGINFVAES